MCIDVIKDMYDKAINRVTTIGGRLNCSQSSFSYLRTVLSSYLLLIGIDELARYNQDELTRCMFFANGMA